MRFLSHVLLLFRKELRVLARDRQATVLLFVMPAVFVFLLSLALSDVYAKLTTLDLDLALVVEDEGEHADSLVRYLQETPGVKLIDLPTGASLQELYRLDEVRAYVRVPLGFSDGIEELVQSSGEELLDAERLEWSVSPTLDASYRSVVQITLTLCCARVVQDQMVRTAGVLGSELEEMAGHVERLAGHLEEAIGQLESTAVQLEGSREEVEEFAAAALAEKAARAEAERARAELEGRAADPEDARWQETERKSAPVTTELIGVDPEETDALTPEERAELDELIQRASSEAAATRDRSAPRIAWDDDLFLVAARDEGGKITLPSPLQQNVPGWSLFAMFFIVVPLSSALHRERAEGTLRRLRTLTVSRAAILGGKLLPYLLVGALQFSTMVLVGLYLVPEFSDLKLELGPKPHVLVPITLVAAFAATSYGLLVAAFTRTPEQAAAFGATSVIVLSVLGGVMIPHFIMPAFLQDAAVVSPLYWGQRAYLDTMLHGAGVADVALPLQVLVGFGVVCLGLAARRIT